MNLIKIFTSLFIIIMLGLQLNGQKVSKLHKKLYEDYDYFIEIIESNPQLDVRRIVQGVNTLDSVKNNRYRVEQCKNYKDFVFLIKEMANLDVDGHFYVGITDDSFDKKAIKANDRYDKYIDKHSLFSWVAPYCEIIDGEFMFVQTYILGKGNSADTIIPAGAILKSVNGISPVEYTSQQRAGNLSHWDWNLKKFISHVVMLESSQIHKVVIDYKGVEKEILIKPAKHSLFGTKFWVKSENKTVKHKIGFFKHQIYDGGGGRSPFRKRRVWYLNEQKILYIGIPEMQDDENYYVNEILKYKDVDIEKIVLDIRGNPGGDDKVWNNILRHILDKPLKTELKNTVVNSNLIRQKLKDVFDFDKMKPITQHQFLPDNKYIYEIEEEIIEPSDSSLNYAGKIFVLSDYSIYSSAGCLIAMSEYHSRIVSIGQPTGYLLGRGCTPVIFQLPNSKLGINMHPMIDLTNVSTPEDVFHDKVEIPVKLSAEEWLEFHNRKEEFNMDYLLNKDLWFKEVLDYQQDN